MHYLMRSKLVLVVVAVMLAATSCLNLSGSTGANFEAIPPLEEIDYSSISTPSPYDFWELRFRLGGAPDYTVTGYGGTMSRNQLSAVLLAQFESAEVDSGFDVECMPLYCYKYIVSVRNGQIEIWNTTERLEQFLGRIESSAEAILFAAGHGYYWDEESLEAGAIRETTTGYELHVLKLVSPCLPVQTDRFELLVNHDGELVVKDSEVWSKLEGACI